MGQQEDNLWIRKEGSEVETVSSGLKFEGGTDLSTEAPMDTGRPDLARAKQPERCKARHGKARLIIAASVRLHPLRLALGRACIQPL